MGEGWGEGEKLAAGGFPLPFIPSHQGRGNINNLWAIDVPFVWVIEPLNNG